MAYITLNQAKKHLNIESDFTEDDEYILSLIAVAEEAVKVHCNEDFDKLVKKEGCLPAPLLQSMLLMVGNLYQQREVVAAKTNRLPFNYQYLIDLYRNYNR